MLTPKANPLLLRAGGDDPNDVSFDAKKLTTPFSTTGKVPTSREIRKLYRVATAAEAIGTLTAGCAIFGITKGQFSLIELIAALLDQTGPADLFISTWTAAGSDLTDAHKLIESEKIRSLRFLVDHTFQRRKPAFAAKIRELFGPESVRVTRNHAKFTLIQNDVWNLVVKTSMNLNFNPRLEDFDIQDDKRLADFLGSLMDEIFKRRKSSDIMDAPAINEKRFAKL